MRRIVFLGNCYAGVLHTVYADAVAPLTGDQCSLIATWDGDAPEKRRLLDEADVIVAQVFDTEQRLALNVESTNAEVVLFPTVSFNSLWPFGGVDHIKNAPLPYWPCGPFDYLMGDNYINRRTLAGAAPEIILRDYLNLDVAKLAHLDRMHEISMGRQRSRDEACGMAFADEVEAHFRSEYLFLNHNRPNVRIATSLTRQVFHRMGVPEQVIENIVSHWRKTPFEQTELPIHPTVATHFGLSYGGPEQRYLYHTGERLTFEEFMTRCALYEWNDKLLSGVAAGFWGGGPRFLEFRGEIAPERLQATVDDLRAGLALSAGSSRAGRVLGEMLLRLGRVDEASAALDRAVRTDPADAEAQNAFGAVLRMQDRTADAEAAFRAAIRHDPWYVDAYVSLAFLLADTERLEEAIAVTEEVRDLRPGNAFFHYDLARLYARAGRHDEAEPLYRKAAIGLADHARPKLYLAEVLLRRDPQSQEGSALLTEARGLQTDDPGVHRDVNEVEARLGLASAQAAA